MTVFSHTLTTLSDEEFLQGEAVIPVTDVTQLISVLRAMLSRVFRSDFQVIDANPVVGAVNFGTLKSMFVKLAKQLHDRE